MENEFYVYHHINKSTGEVFYVGKGKNKRAYSKKARSEFWHNVVNKHGYEVLIVEENITDEQACEREVYWINHFGRKDIGTGILVNHTDGGDGVTGYIFTEEDKQRMSEAHSGEKNGFHGKKHSDETRLKMSLAKRGKTSNMKGKNLSDETKQHLREINLGKTLSAEHKQKIGDSLRGKPGISRSHTEEARKKISEFVNSDKNPKKKRVIQQDMEGNFIQEWPSVSAAKKALKLFHIDAVCRCERNHVGGFKWIYKDNNK